MLADAPGIFAHSICYNTSTAYAVKKQIPFVNNNGFKLDQDLTTRFTKEFTKFSKMKQGMIGLSVLGVTLVFFVFKITPQ